MLGITGSKVMIFAFDFAVTLDGPAVISTLLS